jgi:RNA polymerase sigma-70 factor (ECF subfamily)
MSDHDTLLLQRLAQAGDAEAFSAIITQYAGMVFGTCRRVLGSETVASDAAQETFFHLLKSAHRITGSLGSWLHRVAVNRSLDLLREDVARRQREAAYSAQTWPQ